MEKIRIGVLGYGNLGRGVQKTITNIQDMELVAIFTRRDPLKLKKETKGINVAHISDLELWKDKIDVMLICVGSAFDLQEQALDAIKTYNTVDSYDTHKKIFEYLNKIDKEAKDNKKTAIISAGWDPGFFSLMRLYGESILQDGITNTFWGPGVSQGHTEAIKKIEGVKDAVQYTISKEEKIDKARKGEKIGPTDGHIRKCYVVSDDNADKKKIEREIKSMPNYFLDYETEVVFLTEEEFEKKKSMNHGGRVIRSGKTGEENQAIIEVSLKLDSNPEFTAFTMLTYARACYKLNKMNNFGAKTVFDIPPYLMSIYSNNDLIKRLM